MIKPLETKFDGYRFRSRLEARWAVFLNALGVAWVYEAEGYDLGSVGYYLPDFWLPQLQCHIEIKPESDWDVLGSRSPIVEKQMRTFADAVGPIICFGGVPSAAWTGVLFCYDISESYARPYQIRAGWSICTVCNKLMISLSDEDARLLSSERILGRSVDCREPWSDLCSIAHGRSEVVAPILDAVSIAKSARFEHGEKPMHRR